MEKIVTRFEFIKAKRIIESCKNEQQLQIAHNFAIQVARKIKNDIRSVGSDIRIYFSSIEAFNMTVKYLVNMIEEKRKQIKGE